MSRWIATVVNGKPMMYCITEDAIALRDPTRWELFRYRVGEFLRQLRASIGGTL